MFQILPQSHRGRDLERDMQDFWSENPDQNALLATFDTPLTNHTIFMAEHGVSHRPDFPVQVGATILGIVQNELILNEGYNYSPVKGSPKDCGEIRAFRMGDERVARMAEEGFIVVEEAEDLIWKALKIKVVGPYKPGLNWEINRKKAPTLHPCGSPCRIKIDEHSSTTDSTPIETYAVDLSDRNIYAKESFTHGKMRRIYKGIIPPLTSAELSKQATN